MSRPTVLTWYDRSGRTLGTVADAGNQFDPRLSPDGKKIASVRGDPPKLDVWIHDLESDRDLRVDVPERRLLRARVGRPTAAA